MIVKKIVVGPLETNCYLLIEKEECLIIDPGDDFEVLVKEIGQKKVVGCLITHSHPDHIGALKEILEKYKLNLNEVKSNCFSFVTIKTPGHTKDSVTYYFEKEKCMFTGDFIFKQAIGRTDLGGDWKDMRDSLNKIKKYPEDIKIYPGHGLSTTLREEKNYFSFYCN